MTDSAPATDQQPPAQPSVDPTPGIEPPAPTKAKSKPKKDKKKDKAAGKKAGKPKPGATGRTDATAQSGATAQFGATARSDANPQLPPSRIAIQYVQPLIDDGRYPVKRLVGDSVEVTADIFRDGHDKLAAEVRYRPLDSGGNSGSGDGGSGGRGSGDGERGEDWARQPLHELDAIWDGVRWGGSFSVGDAGVWEYEVAAWTDRFATWFDELARKFAASQHDLSGEVAEGVQLLRETLEHCESEPDTKLLARATAVLDDHELSIEPKFDAVTDAALQQAMSRWQPREGLTTTPTFALQVERERAGYSTWYELFPRSWGGFSGVREQLPKLAALGFDVIYLPPIHPIGLTNRKGRNNATLAAPNDPGSPWAIGDASGGHEAIHPELGTEQDLRQLTAAARANGIEVALDFAVNCSADHPWLKSHPEWFNHRPDGTLKYAENPPKRYQDIYNVNWDTPQWQALWDALLAIVEHWIDCGVTIFRVDNPHTKPWAFWQWLIAQVHTTHPEVIFLAEAFTRRAVMRQLAKVGFTQSYTYFTWKNSRWDLTEYVQELTSSGEQEYFRPNFFVNTPDILHAYLQHGGRPAFEARLVLAATLSPSYGIYSGYENIENVPVAPGSEEYLHSEKYEIKHRSLDGELLPLVATLNAARAQNPALQRFANVTFLQTANDALIAYAKRRGENVVITVVNLDPHAEQQGVVELPGELGLPGGFAVHDLLTDERFGWYTGRNFVAFKPGVRQAHVLCVEI